MICPGMDSIRATQEQLPERTKPVTWFATLPCSKLLRDLSKKDQVKVLDNLKRGVMRLFRYRLRESVVEKPL
jgi:hypothetical protein